MWSNMTGSGRAGSRDDRPTSTKLAADQPRALSPQIRRLKVRLRHPLADRLAQVALAAAGTAALLLILLP